MNHLSTKQPPSLRVFFATEMWERYGFYVVQTLLALYMALHFKWDDTHVYGLVGSFTAMTYLSPIVGGWVADHLLGQKRTILTGAVILFGNYVALALVTSKSGLMITLAGVAVGTGLLKPNISSLLGNEYPLNSPQKESGFTIFYMGITTGIILGTILPSQLNAHFGWSISFASAALGMIIAFLVFSIGIKKYRIADYHPYQYHPLKLLKAIGIIALLWGISFSILSHPRLADVSFGVVVLMAVAYLITTAKRESAKQASQTIVIGLLCIISIMFWAFYFQMFLSLTLFISRVVEPSLFGILFPPPYYVSIESIGMLIFGFFISRHKSFLTVTQSSIRAGNKFLLAMLFMVIAYGFITLVCYTSQGSHLLSPLLFIPAFLLISVAELLLSPVGLSAVTSLASRRKVSTMMGIFFVSLGIGAFLSGKLATLTAIDPAQLSITDLKWHYTQTFSYLFLILGAVTLLCWVLNRMIKQLLSRQEICS